MASKRPRDSPDSSWVSGADGSLFPIQNLPYGIFSHAASGRDPRPGVAIGDMVLDLRAAATEGLLEGLPFAAETVFGGSTLNAFMETPHDAWAAVRARITALLSRGGAEAALCESADLQTRCLVRLAEVSMHMPASIGDYTDFYSSREHATNVGIMFRGKDNALQPNWLHLPVGYHGRASSVVASGTPVVRPKGQLQLDKTDATKGSEHAACRLLDFELEMGFFLGGPPQPLGVPLTMDGAANRIFGFVLCNDWSARDVQKFEYVPLGPFGAKNFATTISPWVVTSAALEPFTCATSAGEQKDPAPLPYLQDPTYSSYDVQLEVELKPPGSSTSTVISRSNYRHMYWTPKQQLVHHSVTGCDMRAADLLASGTISGADETAYGSMLELCWQGTKDVGPLADGTTRKFLKDGDTVNFRGVCKGDGFSIGFGDCSGQVLPAGTVPPPPAQLVAHAALNHIKLQSYWRSTCSWRVRIALAFYGVQYACEPVNLLEGKQADVSPLGQVPRLDWVDGAGTAQSLTQSLAIIEFLCDACGTPTSPSLLPNDAAARAKSRQIAEVINSGTQPLQNLSQLKLLKSKGIDAQPVAKEVIEKGLLAVEALIQGNRDPRFCVGSHPSIADCCLVPQLFNARRYECDMSKFPRAVAVEAHLATLAPFIAALPETQPDAPKK